MSDFGKGILKLPSHVTLQEIKQRIENCSEEERHYLAAFLRSLAQRNDPADREELARRRDEMVAGRRHTLDELKRASQALEALAVLQQASLDQGTDSLSGVEIAAEISAARCARRDAQGD